MAARVFTRDYKARHKRGEMRDYPISQWRSFFSGYEDFTKSVDEIIEIALEKIGQLDPIPPDPKPKQVESESSTKSPTKKAKAA